MDSPRVSLALDLGRNWNAPAASICASMSISPPLRRNASPCFPRSRTSTSPFAERHCSFRPRHYRGRRQTCRIAGRGVFQECRQLLTFGPSAPRKFFWRVKFAEVDRSALAQIGINSAFHRLRKYAGQHQQPASSGGTTGIGSISDTGCGQRFSQYPTSTTCSHVFFNPQVHLAR